MNKNSKRRWWGWRREQKHQGFIKPVYKAKAQPFPQRGGNATTGRQ